MYTYIQNVQRGNAIRMPAFASKSTRAPADKMAAKRPGQQNGGRAPNEPNELAARRIRVSFLRGLENNVSRSIARIFDRFRDGKRTRRRRDGNGYGVGRRCVESSTRELPRLVRLICFLARTLSSPRVTTTTITRTTATNVSRNIRIMYTHAEERAHQVG